MADEWRGLVFEVPTWGWVGLVASERGLRLLSLPTSSRESALDCVRRHYPEVKLAPEDLRLSQAARQICEYLAGERREFAVELDLRGYNPFALAVWAAARRIPYGQTRSYAWIASQVGGGPGAAQAAGAALGDNPIPLIIPCHRVVGADGSLHGFAGGLAMKARLLALEKGQVAFAMD